MHLLRQALDAIRCDAMYECWSWDPHLPACLCDVGPAMVAAAVASAPLSICSGGPLPHPSLSVRGPRPASAGFAGLRRLGTQRAAPLGGALPHGTAASGSAERWRVITESRPTFRISVRLVPGGVLRGEHWLGCLQLTLPSRATAADVFRRLQEEGVRWAPPRPHPLEVALMLEERVEADKVSSPPRKTPLSQWSRTWSAEGFVAESRCCAVDSVRCKERPRGFLRRTTLR
mmetsp:Transcript_45735/g.146775  ORF Transcript_45735/g.146775 Transcript_45735/m.146775 type:complete len:231 (+) Transcript_45735:89-781(+)